MELEFAELHAPIFLSNTNMGSKLDPGKRAGMKLEYNEEKDKLFVYYKDKMSIVPMPNVVSMVPGTPRKPLEQVSHPMIANIGSAQVETPYGHVHAGPGKGKK